jgi:hypothetical protein
MNGHLAEKANRGNGAITADAIVGDDMIFLEGRDNRNGDQADVDLSILKQASDMRGVVEDQFHLLNHGGMANTIE